VPVIPASAYVDPAAIVIGNVTLGEQVSLWPGVVVRGDIHRIVIGARTNIQDGSLLHVTSENPHTRPGGFELVIGADVTVGHRVILHGCTIGDRVLVGMGAILLDGVVVEDDTLIGAGSLVPPGKRLESGYLWLGSPVQRARPLTEREREALRHSAAHYLETMAAHKTESGPVDG
jgi:carbonic anhydrase/acetyltransferase-like protein (isoleucine patch superfamily)